MVTSLYHRISNSSQSSSNCYNQQCPPSKLQSRIPPDYSRTLANLSRLKPLPTIAETLKHPAYPGTIWGLEPHRKGRLPAGKGRGGPYDIAWEVHGDGPIKVVVRPPSLPSPCARATRRIAANTETC